MRLLELSLRSYRVFEAVDLELPARVIGIFGANGSGKSGLLESVAWALYGSARTDKKQIRTQGILTDCDVRLLFEHGGSQYEVRRTIKGRNHQVEAELLVGDRSLAVGVREVDEEIRRLLRMDQQVFRSSVFAEQKQLDAFSDLTKGKRKEMVLRLLGIKPIDDARAAARKESRDLTSDAERISGALPDPAEREAALEAARGAEAEARAAHEEAVALLGEAGTRAKDAEAAFESLDELREGVQRAETERRHAEEIAERLAREKAELEARVVAAKADLERVPALVEERGALGEIAERLASAQALRRVLDDLAHAEGELERVPEDDSEAATRVVEEAEETLRTAREAATEARGVARRAREDRVAAERLLESAGDLDPSQPCPTCGQELGAGFDRYLDHCRAEAARLGTEAAAAAKAAKAAETAEQRAEERHREAKRRELAARGRAEVRVKAQAHVEKLRADVGAASEAFGEEEPDLASLRRDAERAGEIDRLLARAEGERAHLEKAEAQLVRLTAEAEEAGKRVAALAKEIEALAFDPDAHERARVERDEARKLLEEARGAERDASDRAKEAEKAVAGIAADLERIRETASKVDEMREDARYAERVSLLLDGFRDHLVGRIGPELSREAEALFRELTNHEYEDLKVDEETLAIQIADGGAWWPIERFSGSETDLANLALRVAISTHLSRVAGADLGMMVLDEVLASLDAERKDLMVQAMGRLSNRFHQLFVITHAEQVKDQFPATIEVRKVGRRRSEAVLV